MNEKILNYIIQAILGGASGYITNDYAINMLFKEYTPFKIGGVIKKTRHEFIENISNMVENDIINKDKLQEILSDSSFIKEFENLTADFYNKSLYEEAGTYTFDHIDGFEQSIESTDIFAAKIIDQHMPELLNLISDQINVNDFLSDKQIDKVSGSLYSSLSDLIENDIFENFILSIIKSNDKLILNSIISKESYNTITSNFVNIFLNALSESDSEKIIELITSIGLGDALNSSKQVIGNKKIKEVINLNSDALNSITESFLKYMNSDSGINLVNSLLNSLFLYGKKSNKSIFQILDTSFEENLKLYLINIIPSVTENIVSWVNLNSCLIDELIVQSIDEVIKESDGIKSKLLSVIKNTYLKDLSKNFNIANKIISYIEKIAEPEKLSENLSDELIEILSNLTLKEIIGEAENNNITPESIGNFVLNYINKNTESIITKFIDYIFEIEINKLLPVEAVSDDLKFSIINKLKELASTNLIKNYLTAKSNEYAEFVLSKELGELIDDEKAVIIASKSKKFILSQIILNEESIKTWFIKEVHNITETSPVKLNSDSINQINTELYKIYESTVEKLKDVQLSTALDKLNSIDNLSINSSESIRSYAVKNVDIILGGSIKAIATDNLNKLNDDELVDLANDFIGRELKPIMYFGGILGVVAGLILATFQNPTLDPAKFNIANMLVYSFVGFITNVIAINMIFKPYKEVKLLSKIPFLRNFSLGYIIKNQKTFAKNTAHFIDNSLLSKTSINEIFNKYDDKIKTSFTKSIAENDYKTISNLLFNNKSNVVKSFYSFIKTKSKENTKKISLYFYNKISNIKASSLMNDMVRNKLSNSITEGLLSPSLNNKMHSLISSDATIESELSEKIAKKYINEVGTSYFDKLSFMLYNEKELNNFILNYEGKYNNYIHKSINEIIDNENRDKLANSVAGKINNIILSKKSRDQISSKSISLVNKLVDRNKSFGEIFNGKIKDYADSQMPKILESLTKAIVNYIKESKSEISSTIQSEIKIQLGFIEKSMYSIMGGNEIVNELLSKIILDKVPKFLDDKKLELSSMLNILLEQKLYKAKVEVLYTGLNKLQLNDIVDSYLNSDNSLKIENKINKITNDLFIMSENVKLNSILNLFYANELNVFLDKYNKEIHVFTNKLNSNINNNKLQIAEKLLNFTDSLADKFLQSSFKDAFTGISKDDIQYVQDKIYQELSKNGFNNILNSTFDEFKNNFTENVGEFIDTDEFMKAVEKGLLTLIENSEFEETVKNHIDSIINKVISDNLSFIDNKTKKYLLDIFVESCISSLKRNLDEILKSIEFDKIALEEIEKMEPKKIHELFDSFAGKYFKKLMLYGFGGFIFGVNMYVGFSLTLLKTISELFNKGSHK